MQHTIAPFSHLLNQCGICILALTISGIIITTSFFTHLERHVAKNTWNTTDWAFWGFSRHLKYNKFSPPELSKHVKYDTLSLPEPSRHVKYDTLSLPEPSGHVKYDRLSLPEPSIPKPSKCDEFTDVLCFQTRQIRQIEPPRAFQTRKIRRP